MKVILEVTIADGEQGAATRITAQRAAEALLRAAHKVDGYFGAIARVEDK